MTSTIVVLLSPWILAVGALAGGAVACSVSKHARRRAIVMLFGEPEA